MTDQNETVINELYDVQVDTLGLVTRGANREEFFLLKSLTEGEDEQPREVTPTETGKQNEQKTQGSLGKRFKTLLRGIVKQEVKQEFDTLAKDVTANYVTVLSDAATDTPAQPVEATAKTDTEPVAVEVTGTEPGSSTDTLEVTESPEPIDSGLSKQENIEMSDTVDIEKAELKNKLAEMEIRLAKAEEVAAVEKEARDRQIYIAKADTMPALPIAKAELADHLYWLSKTDARRAQWFESALTAANNMLADSALLKEFGTRHIPEPGGLIEKAQALVDSGKATDLGEALLSLPRGEAAVYVAKRQSETGSR